MLPPNRAIERPRPDRRGGVFETILIFAGRPIELDAHLARLASSVRTLYGEEPSGLGELVLGQATGWQLGRMRLTVTPVNDDGLDASVQVAGLDPRKVFPTGDYVSKLTQLRVDRGYGGHKWVDRELLARAEAEAGPGAVPLLVNEECKVLEASRSNIFIVSRGRLLTPPLDGGILPGVARARVIEIAADWSVTALEQPLDLESLHAAEEVFLTNALRGVEPVSAIDGEPLRGEGPLTREMAAAMRDRWFRP